MIATILGALSLVKWQLGRMRRARSHVIEVRAIQLGDYE